MALKVYLKQNNTWNEISVNSGGAITSTLDETLDSGSFILAFTSSSSAIKPRTKVKVNDGYEDFFFEVVLDSVEVVSHSPLTYRHTITLAQNTRELTKHLIRNSVFSQPAQTKYVARDYTSGLAIRDYYYSFKQYFAIQHKGRTDYNYKSFSKSISISSKQKISSAIIKLDIQEQEASVSGDLSHDPYYADVNATTSTNKFVFNSIKVNILKDGTIISGIGDITLTSSNNYTYELSSSQIAYLSSYGEYTIKIKQLTTTPTESSPSLCDIDISFNGTTSNFFEFALCKLDLRLEVETYYYSLYDVLDQIKDNYKPDSENISETKVYNLPSSGAFYNALQEVAPNFVFTQNNMYEAVQSVCEYLDGVVYMDDNNTLNIEYFNDNDTSLTYDYSMTTDIGFDIKEDYYANGIVADYQKGHITGSVWYPSENGYTSPRPTILGLAQANTWGIYTDQNIDYIENMTISCSELTLSQDFETNGYFYCKLNQDTQGFGDFLFIIKSGSKFLFDNGIDISDYVFEKDLWSLLEKTTTNSTSAVNRNTIWYEKGNNYIYTGALEQTVDGTTITIQQLLLSAISRTFGMNIINVNKFSSFPITGYKDGLFRVKYKPYTNGRVKVDTFETKDNGEYYSTQGNANVLMEKLGLNMLGLSVKNGVQTCNASVKINSYANRVKKGTIWTDSNGDKWFANKVKTTFFNDFIVCDIEFSKNFNKLSNFVKINQDKRFYEISSDLTTLSEDTYVEYINFYADSSTYANASAIKVDSTMLNKYIYNTIGGNDTTYRKPDFASCSVYNIDGSSTISVSTNKYLPLRVYGSGNNVCFEMAYQSPISAGNKLDTTDGNQGVISKYCDDLGFGDYFFLRVSAIKTSYSNVDFGSDIPQLQTTLINDKCDHFLNMNWLKYQKRPNEIFALNYQLSLQTEKVNEIIFGKEFLNNNFMVSGKSHKLRVGIATDYKYSILDSIAVYDTEIDGILTLSITSPQTNVKSFKLQRNGIDYTLPYDIKSWVIFDENENILLAFNKELESGDNLSFGYFTSHNKLSNI